MYFWFTSGMTTWSREPVLEGKVAKYDPLIGYRLSPHSYARHRGPEFDTHIAINAQGMRMDRDVSYETPPGKQRILLIGDSFTFGHGVNVQDRFGERLEKILTSVEVLNMGVWGTGTDQQYLLYREEGVKFNADLVILLYLVENITRNGNDGTVQHGDRMLPKPRFRLQEGKLVLTNVPVPKHSVPINDEQRQWQENQGIGIPIPFKGFLREHSALYRLLHSRGSNTLHQLFKTEVIPFPQYQEDREAWQITKLLFKQFANEASQNGSEFLLVILPTQEFVNRTHIDPFPQKMIIKACKASRIGVLDMLPALKRMSSESEHGLYYAMDGHWNVDGHKAAARIIADYLTKHLNY